MTLREELITRERAERAVPLQDCSGRYYIEDEREDIIRYVILGAEIQRDKGELFMTNTELLMNVKITRKDLSLLPKETRDRIMSEQAKDFTEEHSEDELEVLIKESIQTSYLPEGYVSLETASQKIMHLLQPYIDKKVEERDKLIEQLLEIENQADFSNGNTDEFGTIDESVVMAHRFFESIRKDWQSLKEKS